MDSHDLSHQEQKSKFPCDECEKMFNNNVGLEDHIKRFHQDSEEEFNCNDCDYQGNTKIGLETHLKLKEHTPSKIQEVPAPENGFICRECGQTFLLKKDLMTHRKTNHEERVNICRYFIKKTCVYDSEMCWYRHEEKETNVPLKNLPKEDFT